MNPRSALREPTVWLILGLVAFAMIASFALLAGALRNGGADEVRDDVQSAGDMQLTEIGPDERARSMHLSVVLRVGETAIDVRPVDGEFARNQTLILLLSHPVDATQDRRLILQPSELGWSIPIDVIAGHDWIAQLAPADQSWRLRGRLKAGQRAAPMVPAFAGD